MGIKSALLAVVVLGCVEPVTSPEIEQPRVSLDATASTSSRMNVVVVQVDDMRADFMQYLPRTRALLGDSGVTFSKSFVTTPLCCPSRASFLTGQVSHTHGVLTNFASTGGGATKFNDATTLATQLRGAGYRTGFIGKYLNEYAQLRPWPYVAPGWDLWRGIKIPNSSTGDFTLVSRDSVTGTTSEVAWSGSAWHETHVLRDMSLAFIRSTPDATPVFLYLAPSRPHVPAIPAPEDAGSAAGTLPWRPRAWREPGVADKPPWVRAFPASDTMQERLTDEYRIKAIESLRGVDRMVDSVVAVLRQTGRLANSAVIFTSDNGYMLGEHRLHRLKAAVYEESIRVPLLVRAPNLVARVDTNIVANIDLAPTILEWAQVVPSQPMQGVSLVGLLSNPATPWRADLLIESLTTDVKRNFSAVRDHRYLYSQINGTEELYDLRLDSAQMVSRHRPADSVAYGAIKRTLSARLAVLKTQ